MDSFPNNNKKNNVPPILDKRLVNAIAILVSVVWAISFVCDIFLPGYNPSPFIHLAMMTVVGAALGHGFIRGGDN